MEKIKNYILNFYKTHDPSVSIKFYEVKEAFSIATNQELNTILQELIREGFIECTLNADNVIFYFRLKQ